MKRRTKNKYTCACGFTLIEVMIALVLLSMLLLLLFGSLFTATKHWQIGEMKINKNNEVRLVNKFIRQKVSQATPILWVNKDGKRLLFKGENNELKFVASLPAHRGGGGLYELTLKVSKSKNGNLLGLNYVLLDPQTEPFSDSSSKNGEFIAIANGINSIKLSYYGNEKINEEPGWLDEWKSDEQLPQLLQIQLTPENETYSWPLIEIPIKPVFNRGQTEFMIKANLS